MTLNFKNRIALYFMVATAILVALVFLTVFFSVKGTVYSNLDKDLTFEAKKHSREIGIRNDSIYFLNKAELIEREHTQVQVYPVFIQIIDLNGQIMDKSPNLKGEVLVPSHTEGINDHFNTQLSDRLIRQMQLPITINGKKEGYIIAAMSLEASRLVITNLQNTLLLSYPIVLIVLFFVTSYLAGRSILPIQTIINTTNKITKNNLKERVELPANKDELFQLSSAINHFLQRIESAIQRERQFTSDASHELRNPLSSLRGTLEVLVRKPRTQAEYEEKVNYSLTEIDRMSAIVEQLLLLARFDSDTHLENKKDIALSQLIDDILLRYKTVLQSKNISVNFDTSAAAETLVPQYHANLILDNVLNNAIKYSKENSTISIKIEQDGESIKCTLKDEGIGIKKEDILTVFNPFFRSNALDHKGIQGSGLGLSIAKKAADAIDATLSIDSDLGKGTSVTLIF